MCPSAITTKPPPTPPNPLALPEGVRGGHPRTPTLRSRQAHKIAWSAASLRGGHPRTPTLRRQRARKLAREPATLRGGNPRTPPRRRQRARELAREPASLAGEAPAPPATALCYALEWRCYALPVAVLRGRVAVLRASCGGATRGATRSKGLRGFGFGASGAALRQGRRAITFATLRWARPTLPQALPPVAPTPVAPTRGATRSLWRCYAVPWLSVLQPFVWLVMARQGSPVGFCV